MIHISEEEEKIYSKSKFILITVIIGAFLSMFGIGVVNVGLPTIAKEFDVEVNTVQWVTSVYLLVMSALLPILGTLSDKIGRRKIYNLGYIIIGVFTLLSSFSGSLSMLIVTRIFQAIGGAMIMANGLAIVTENYPPKQRGRNIGLLVTMMAIGAVSGPSLGGIIIGLWGWRAIFYFIFIVSLAGFLASYYSIPKDGKAPNEKMHFDYLGSVLLIVSILTFVYSFSSVSKLGWSNPLVYGSIIIFVISLTLFIILERKIKHPILDLGLFKNHLFTTSIIAALLSFITMYSPTVLIPFYYQDVLKYSATQSGLFMMAFPIAMAIVSPFSGALSDKIGAVFLTTSGLIINGIALILLANTTINTSLILILIYFSLMGLSLGLFQSPNNSSIMSSVPKTKLGAASGITQLVKNLGMVIGIAFSVSLFTALLGNGSVSNGADYLHSTKIVYYIAAGLSFAGAFISGIRNKKTVKID